MEYFDTGNDPRIIFAEKAVAHILKVISSRKIAGIRRGTFEEVLNEIQKLVKNLRWSYLPKDQLSESEVISGIERAVNELRKLMDETKIWEKDRMVAAFLQFVLRTLATLKERILVLPDDYSSAVDYRFVKVLNVEKHPSAEKLYVLRVTDGRGKYIIVTNDPSIRKGDVVPVAFLPPKEFFGIISEGMIIGGASGVRRGTKDDVGKIPKLEINEMRKLKGEIMRAL